MTIVSELIAQGILSEDNTRADGIIIHVPIKTTAAAINNGGFALFAEAIGWQPDIHVERKDEEGNTALTPEGLPIIDLIENPVKDYEAAISNVQDYVGQKFDEVIAKQAQQQAEAVKEQVETQLKAAFGR
jgi:hypothetical protein